MPATTAAVLPATSSPDPTWLIGVILTNHTEPVLVAQRRPDRPRWAPAR